MSVNGGSKSNISDHHDHSEAHSESQRHLEEHSHEHSKYSSSNTVFEVSETPLHPSSREILDTDTPSSLLFDQTIMTSVVTFNSDDDEVEEFNNDFSPETTLTHDNSNNSHHDNENNSLEGRRISF